jgi:hypothetical protein
MRVLRHHGAIRTFFAWPKHGRRPVVCVAVSLVLALASLPLNGQTHVAVEYRSKARYLSNFPSFVEWPAEAWSSEKEPFLICVFGDYPFGTSLAEETRGRTVHERRIEVQWMHTTEQLHACQMLFVSRSEPKRYSQVLQALRGRMMLTVGETPEFLDAEGMVSFSTEDESVRFDVNLGEANKAHLKISSHMLALARRVVNPAEAAKS